MASVARSILSAGRCYGSIVTRMNAVASISRAPRRHLPVCTVDTSLPVEGVPDSFNKELSALLASILNKSEENITVSLRTGVRMCRAGNVAATASVHIWSIGVFDAERNPAYSKALYDFLAPRLGLPTHRITILFHPITKETAGHLLYTEMMAKS